MEAYSGERWWDVIVSADTCAKPNPGALQMAIEAVSARGGLFIGDTADDHDLVRHYLAGKTPEQPPILAAMLINEGEDELYQQRGVDLIVRSVEDLLKFWAA
jgi:HAD superfamily phosphatase